MVKQASNNVQARKFGLSLLPPLCDIYAEMSACTGNVGKCQRIAEAHNVRTKRLNDKNTSTFRDGNIGLLVSP